MSRALVQELLEVRTWRWKLLLAATSGQLSRMLRRGLSRCRVSWGCIGPSRKQPTRNQKQRRNQKYTSFAIHQLTFHLSFGTAQPEPVRKTLTERQLLIRTGIQRLKSSASLHDLYSPWRQLITV